MAEKPITLEQLQRDQEDGAEYEFDTEVTEIRGFSDLIDNMKRMVANEAERIRADIARNQTNLEILATLQSMIRKQGQGPAAQPADMQPIRDLLEEIRAERLRASDPVDYDFKILRSGPGFSPAVEIQARAIKPTAH